MNENTALLLHSTTALAAVRAERDAILDMADAIADAHPAMPADDALALAEESFRNE